MKESSRGTCILRIRSRYEELWHTHSPERENTRYFIHNVYETAEISVRSRQLGVSG